ncbi:MAG: type II toxin-antitoxin system YoeB family toxin [Paludibacteraceae bacterium]|jgi:Txe/YoeB family toxin of Txe-Axe toxin-antitoxin module|nr:type II toxin-antitoxin system YoeB family toxin [Paludibacteraceae bacterium]
MKLQFSSKALTTFELVKKNSPELAEKIKSILKDMLLHPAEGVGEPVCLNGEFKDVWQRKISHNEYINYMFNNEVLVVISIQVNESTKNLETSEIKLEGFTEDEYNSVMKLMSSNRGKDSEPKVGIFWYNRANKTLFGVVSHRLSDYTKANASDGRITCSEMHEDVWKKAYYKQRFENNGVGPFIGAYQDKPRGRIFYNIENDVFEVAVGKWLEEFPEAYDLILKEFDLPPEKTQPKYAVHWDIGMSWR